MTAHVQRNLMTPLQQRRARWLAHCRFAPATFDKRFARELGARLHAPEPLISWREAATLERLCWRYRGQLAQLLARDGEPRLDLIPEKEPPPPTPRVRATAPMSGQAALPLAGLRVVPLPNAQAETTEEP